MSLNKSIEICFLATRKPSTPRQTSAAIKYATSKEVETFKLWKNLNPCQNKYSMGWWWDFKNLKISYKKRKILRQMSLLETI